MYIGIEAQGSVPCVVGGDLVVSFLGHLLYAKKDAVSDQKVNVTVRRPGNEAVILEQLHPCLEEFQ